MDAIDEINGSMMSYLYLNIQVCLRDEDGTASIEYVLIASLIAVVIMVAVSALGVQVCERMRSVSQALGATGVAACL